MLPQHQNAGARTPTMSSVELVQVINDLREVGRAELRHDHFMVKIDRHPGIDGPKFRGIYRDAANREKPCYHLPKRECELMVMSESLEVQTKVYDRLTELEVGVLAAPVAPVATPIDAAKMFTPFFRVARLIGCDKNASAISANQAVKSVTGTNVLALMGQTHLVNEPQELCFTPTELGMRLCMSAKAFNQRLAERGMQTHINGKWVPTDKGQQYAVILDTGKSHGGGTPVQQVKWRDSVMGEVTA